MLEQRFSSREWTPYWTRFLPKEDSTLEQGKGVRRKELAEGGCNKLTRVPILLHHSGMGGRGVRREGVKLSLAISTGAGGEGIVFASKKKKNLCF